MGGIVFGEWAGNLWRLSGGPARRGGLESPPSSSLPRLGGSDSRDQGGRDPEVRVLLLGGLMPCPGSEVLALWLGHALVEA